MKSQLNFFRACCVAFAMMSAPAVAQQNQGDDRDYDAPRDELPWNGGSGNAGSSRNSGYPEPVPPPPTSYKDDAPAPEYRPAPRRQAQCLSKPGLRNALNDQGWHEFDQVDYRGELAFMTATNERGRRFEVEFDACSGDVVNARPLQVYVDAVPPPRVYPYYGHRYFGPPRPYIGVRAYRHRHHGGRWR